MFRTSLLLLTAALVSATAAESGYKQLFNGKNLDGWKITEENKDTFKVKDGEIVANGPRAHLFYAGKVNNANFKNFELKLDIMAEANSNGGVYFHTEYQPTGWPSKGFEVQVNNTHKDTRKGAGLYAVKDNPVPPAKDGEWYTMTIRVVGDKVTTLVNDKPVTEWTQPADWAGVEGTPGRKLSAGTFALQGHDPGSTTRYKNIRVKPLK